MGTMYHGVTVNISRYHGPKRRAEPGRCRGWWTLKIERCQRAALAPFPPRLQTSAGSTTKEGGSLLKVEAL